MTVILDTHLGFVVLGSSKSETEVSVKSIHINTKTKPRRHVDFERVNPRGFFCGKEVRHEIFSQFPFQKNEIP